MAKIQDDDFSAFDDVVSQPDSQEEDDFSAFDEVAAAPEVKQSFLERAASNIKSSFTPSQETEQIAESVIDSGLDFSKGVAGGLTMNAMDELGGLAGAAVEKGLSYIPGTSAYEAAKVDEDLGIPQQSFLDKYRDYQSGIEADVNKSEERSPVLSTLGQIGGGITSGVALGGLLGMGPVKGAKGILDIARDSGKGKAALELLKRGGANYAKATPAIALESALTSEEQLIGDNVNPEGVAADVAGGLAFGLPTMLGMQGFQETVVPKSKEVFSKIGSGVSELVEDSPMLRQIKLAYQKYGQELGVNPTSETAVLKGVPRVEGGASFSDLNVDRAVNLTKEVLEKDKQLGAIVGTSLDQPTRAGQKIDAQDLVNDTYNKIIDLSKEMPSLTKDENFNNVITKVMSRNYKTASPRDIKNAMDDITNSIERINGYKLPSPELEEALPFLRDLRKGLDVRLKDQVPEYRDAAERFSQYRQTYVEQPIAGGHDPVTEDIYYGSMKKGEQKLTNAYEDLVAKSTSGSQANFKTEERYSRLLKKAKEFQAAEEARVAAGKIKAPITQDPDQFMQKIKDFADDAAVRRSTRTTQESQAGGTMAVLNSMGIGNTGRGKLYTTAYLAGRGTQTQLAKKVSNLSRAVYNAPAQTLSNLATKLEASPGTGALGKALREGLENGDSAKRNAALFTIMQNPNARLMISSEDFPNEEQE